MIQLEGRISISIKLEPLFEYISNLENDTEWRKEINNSQMVGIPQLHVKATESSYLSRKAPNSILHLECTAFESNKKIVYQTLSESPCFLKSIREVESISEKESQFIYKIEFDKAIVKRAIGFNLPNFIIKIGAKKDMKKYLKKLKEILENKSQT